MARSTSLDAAREEPGSIRRTTPGKARDIVFGLTFALALLASVEAGMRALGLPRDTGPTSLEVNLDRISIAHLGQRAQPWLAGDPELLWRFQPHLHQLMNSAPSVSWMLTTNSMGFRGEEIPAHPGRPLVLCAGDSCTVGYGAADQDSYPAVLQQRLRQLPGFEQATVINTAVNGYSSEQGRFSLARTIPEFHPDVVIIDFGINDSWSTVFSDTALIDRHPLVRWAQKWLRRSHIYEALRDILVTARWRHAEAHRKEGPRVALPRYQDNLRAMVDLARAHGAVPVFVAVTSKYEHFQYSKSISLTAPLSVYRSAMGSVAAQLRVPMLDIPLLSGRERASRWFFCDAFHPTSEGLCILARGLVPVVQEAVAPRLAAERRSP